MAHTTRFLIAAAALLLGCGAAGHAEEGVPATPPPWERKGANFEAIQNVHRALQALTPEQRKIFAENLLRWAKLPPEQKNALREREAMRQRFIEKEVDEAIRKSGLKLEGERRTQFVRRFMEERRKLEEKLQSEMAEKRQSMVREIVSQLTSEFAEAPPQ